MDRDLIRWYVQFAIVFSLPHYSIRYTLNNFCVCVFFVLLQLLVFCLCPFHITHTHIHNSKLDRHTRTQTQIIDFFYIFVVRTTFERRWKKRENLKSIVIACIIIYECCCFFYGCCDENSHLITKQYTIN